MTPSVAWMVSGSGLTGGARCRTARPRPWRLATIAVVVAIGLPLTQAGQVVLDGQLGTSGALSGPSYDVTADLGRIKGKNLFHSFSDFDLDAGDTATFFGPSKIRNILARTTGGNPSSINGTVRSDIAGANLFFLNPAGVIFGPNAVIDVTGSFAVSTADYLRLAGGARFGVGLDPSADSKLTSRPVVAFGFLNGDPGNITIQAPLATAAGKTFSAVGGDILLDGGQILAADGRVNLVSAKAAGEVVFRSAAGHAVDVTRPRAIVRVNGLEQQGSIELRNSAAVDVSGEGGGKIVIRGGRLVVENSSVKADTHGATAGRGVDIRLTETLEVLGNGKITTDASGAGRGGDILIRAPSILVDGQDLEVAGEGNSPNRTRLAAETSSDRAQATGGDIILTSDSLELRGGAEISTSTFGPAQAGRVDITTTSLMLTGPTDPFISPPTWIRANASPFLDNAGAGGDIEIRADSIQIAIGALLTADTPGGADAGRIRITTTSLSMLDGAITTRTAGPGDGGAIEVRADTILMDGIGAFLGAETSGEGKGGDIGVTAASVLMVNNALVSASSFGDGDGGNITIHADSLMLDTAEIPSGIIASSDGGAGDGGDIEIQAGSLELQNAMQISTSSSVTGDGGEIAIQATSVVLGTGSSVQSATTGSGIAGGVDFDVNQLSLSGGSFISVSAAENEAGRISVLAEEIHIADGQVSASAPQASGGSIELFASRTIELVNSFIQAAANDHGGNLSLGSPLFIFDPLFQGSIDAMTIISANAIEIGGNITIGEGFSIAAPENITATGKQEGQVEIGAPQVDLSGSLVALAGDLLSAEIVLCPDCAVRLTGGLSSFVLLGRGGLPLEPGGFVPSSLPPGEDDRH